MMKVIVITSPEFVTDEAEIIRILLCEGADRVHLRKPESSEKDFRRLVEAVPEQFRKRLTFQDHLPLATEYGAGGVHLNARNPQVPDGFCGLVSRSCHSFGEVSEHSGQSDYLFLSPIFDSISKQGYSSHFSEQQLMEAGHDGILGPKVIALGGILPKHLPLLGKYGFGGAAFLGYVWKDVTPEAAAKRIRAIRKFKLSY